jgi:hypothetical protein
MTKSPSGAIQAFIFSGIVQVLAFWAAPLALEN